MSSYNISGVTERANDSSEPSASPYEVSLIPNVLLLSWRIEPDHPRVRLSAEMRRTDITWFSIGFGKSMVDASAFVAVRRGDQVRSAPYVMTGRKASDVSPVNSSTVLEEPILNGSESSGMSFTLDFHAQEVGFGEFTYDAMQSDVPVIWAYGASWSAAKGDGSSPRQKDKHTASSSACLSSCISFA